jgi:hypothetical protein
LTNYYKETRVKRYRSRFHFWKKPPLTFEQNRFKSWLLGGRARRLFQRLVGSSRILLFYSSLPDKRLVLHPNRKAVVCSPCLSDKVGNYEYTLRRNKSVT